jgi:CPA2 family monovalent cation:H+ antiporter-2
MHSSRTQEQRSGRYRLMREFFRGDEMSDRTEARDARRLRSIVLAPESPSIGRALGELDLGGVTVTTLVRRGERRLAPPDQTRLLTDDVIVASGAFADLERADQTLPGSIRILAGLDSMEKEA